MSKTNAVVVKVSAFEKNYFELFDQPLTFDIDIDVLRECYRNLQKAAHPDNYANTTEQLRRLSMQLAAQINDAFQTLSDPLLRAGYLLSLLGVEKIAENQTLSDPDFLLMQMESRERLEQMAEHSASSESYADYIKDINGQIDALVETIRTCFNEGSHEHLLKAQTLVQKMQFLERLRKEAEVAEEESY